MKFKYCVLSLFFTIIMISCNDSKKEPNTENVEIKNTDTSREIKNEIPEINRDSIIKKLQGEWKELEYPFRLAHFKNTEVKFTEEGVAETPRFREYIISEECPFDVNNIKNATPDDMFLVMAEAKTCEILNISNDTLTLSGFNTHTNSDYKIIYKKVE